MPKPKKTVAKSSPKKAKAKAAVKAKPAAAAAKPTAKSVQAKRSAAPAPAEKSGFMWKLLERKEAELKRREQARGEYGTQPGGRTIHADAGHARFNGPRRKAA